MYTQAITIMKCELVAIVAAAEVRDMLYKVHQEVFNCLNIALENSVNSTTSGLKCHQLFYFVLRPCNSNSWQLMDKLRDTECNYCRTLYMTSEGTRAILSRQTE